MYCCQAMTEKPVGFGSTEAASRGGKARARRLSPEALSGQSRLAAQARWAKTGQSKTVRATHGSTDHPLRLGDSLIPCFVLEDGRRVLHQRGLVSALGMARGSSGGTGGDRLAKFVAGDRLKSFISEQLRSVTQSPIRFITTDGLLAYGYEAVVLADICEAVLAARTAGLLQKQQEHIAQKCEILVRGFARVGIVALVDEATGFQYDRPRRDLEAYLERYLSESLRRWVRTFPADYFKHLCRLRNVELRPDMKLPSYFGHLTRDLVYRRIAPGLLRRLEQRRSELGRPSNKLHQWTSEDLGHPELLLHLGTVVGLMKIHTNYDAFKAQLDTVAPVFPNYPGLFDNPEDWEVR
jgi:hypothetical protein